MRSLRVILFVCLIAMLCLGYAESQFEYFSGAFQEYASKIDSPPVQHASLVFLILTVILGFWPETYTSRRKQGED